MPSTPLSMIQDVYEANFGIAEELLPAEEVKIEGRRIYVHQSLALIEAVMHRGQVSFDLFQTRSSESLVYRLAHEWANLGAREPISTTSGESRSRYNELVQQWHKETDFLSSPTDVVLNFNYQQIIGMGPDVLPLVIEELRERGGRWFWALRAITGEDPVPEEAQGNTAKMKEAWLKWWDQKA